MYPGISKLLLRPDNEQAASTRKNADLERTMKTSSRIATFTLVGLAVLVAGGCASSGTPTIQTGPDAEVTFDGLHRVDHSQAEFAWARPDFDISGYSKILPVSSGFEYRKATNQGRTAAERNRGGPYIIDDSARERFESMVAEVFQEELGKMENWEFVTEPGPDVMILRGGMLDIFTNVPPDNQAGRVSQYVSAVGQATLVLELRDSQTNTVLARSIDRRWAERPGGQMFEANRVTSMAEARRLVRMWATRLRESLDGFAEQQRGN
jgi:hypothetical protein